MNRWNHACGLIDHYYALYDLRELEDMVLLLQEFMVLARLEFPKFWRGSEFVDPGNNWRAEIVTCGQLEILR